MISEVSINDIPKRHKLKDGAVSDIRSFISSGAPAAEVKIPDGKTARKVAPAYRYAITRGGYPVRQIVRGDRLFLVREGDDNA